jgi:DNA-3-methyladenine glycosylase I
MTKDTTRCPWAGTDPLMQAYHDREWGTPLHDERGLFEFLILEGAQAGLSWSTILNKREAYRRAFSRFDPVKVAAYRAPEIKALLANPGIVRNRLKVEGAVKNAKAFLALRDETGGADGFLWQFVGGRPKKNGWTRAGQVPATTPESDAMSKALKRRGFTFVGSTICYAFMQATGMVDDHVADCFRSAGVR